jgi:putative membrane protein
MKTILKIFLNGVFFFLLSLAVPSYLTVEGFPAALAASLLFALVNTFLKPLFLLMTLPLNILTFGLFTLVVNGFMIYLVSAILRPNFGVSGFLQAVIIALLISIFNLIISRWLEHD